MRAGGALNIGLGFTRAHGLRAFGFAAAISVLAVSVASAETRTLRLFNIHTKEDLTIAYKKDGQFDPAALKRLNTYLRDWRQEKEVTMDPQLFDMLWEVHREVKASGPIHVVCGYRSPNTNEMLRNRSRSSGVAKTSLHMQGKAIDFSIPSANVADVRAAALRIQGGGVGYYPTSGIPFVHMDVGNVRHWPRMTRDQLARVFPNGRTLHVSTSGPLSGYEQAKADAERNGGRLTAIASAEAAPQGNLIASLFNRFRNSSDPEETEDNATNAQTAAASRRQPARTAPTPAAEPVVTAQAPAAPAEAVPLPRTRPAFQVASAPTYQVASATQRAVPAPAPRVARTDVASLSPNQIIQARGYWQGLPEVRETVGAARRTPPVQVASADGDMTASVGPFARTDRVAPDVALAYAADQPATFAQRSAILTQQDTATVAAKPAAPATVRPVKDTAKVNDPWIRGLVLASDMHRSMVTTTFGQPDLRALAPFMQKPAMTLVMTFSGDPNPGTTYDTFSGSAVVFQATMTFGVQTAHLNR